MHTSLQAPERLGYQAWCVSLEALRCRLIASMFVIDDSIFLGKTHLTIFLSSIAKFQALEQHGDRSSSVFTKDYQHN